MVLLKKEKAKYTQERIGNHANGSFFVSLVGVVFLLEFKGSAERTSILHPSSSLQCLELSFLFLPLVYCCGWPHEVHLVFGFPCPLSCKEMVGKGRDETRTYTAVVVVVVVVVVGSQFPFLSIPLSFSSFLLTRSGIYSVTTTPNSAVTALCFLSLSLPLQSHTHAHFKKKAAFLVIDCFASGHI